MISSRRRRRPTTARGLGNPRLRLRAAATTVLLATVTATTSATASSSSRWDPYVSTCAPNIPQPLQPHGRFGCPIPLDDAPSTHNYSPWTHPPSCVNSSAIAGRPAGRYCVYTNSQHGVGGLSLVTTPESAADSADTLNEDPFPPVPLGSGSLRDMLFDPADPPYEIVEVPGKGKGVVATRNIRKYETLMVDYAAMLVDLYLPSTVVREQGYVLLNAAADRLDDPRRVLNMARSNSMAGNPIEDVLRTNAHSMEFGGAPHMVLFPEVARINHACLPNAFPRFAPRSLTASVAAMRDIRKGEEITVSYLTLGQPYMERQKGLLRWNFKCTCSLCSGDGDATAASDTRRLKISAKRDQALKAYQDGSGERAIELTEEILDLLKTEGLDLLYGEQYENMGRIHWAMGDRAQGEAWARRSLRVLADQGYIEEVRPGMVRALLRSYEEDVEASKHPDERGKVEEPELQGGPVGRGDDGEAAEQKEGTGDEGRLAKNEFLRRFEEEVAKLKAKMASEAAEGKPTATLTPWSQRMAEQATAVPQNAEAIADLKRKLQARLASMKEKMATVEEEKREAIETMAAKAARAEERNIDEELQVNVDDKKDEL